MNKKRENKYKLKLFLAILFAMTLSLCAIPMSNVYAGTSGTTGSSTSSGGGGGSSSIYKVGKSNGCRGLKWVNHNGSVDWSTDAPYAEKYGGKTFTANATKWACIQKHGRDAGWFNMRFAWFFGACRLKNTPGWYSRNYYGGANKFWANSQGGTFLLADSDLHNEAVNNGYTPDYTNEYYINSAGDKLDIVWIEDVYTQRSSTESKKIIVYGESSGTPIIDDRSGWTPQSLWDSDLTSLTYDVTTGETELNHRNIIKGKIITVTKTTTWEQNNAGATRNYNTSYSKGGVESFESKVSYDVTQPNIDQTYFRPYDLNRNGLANESDVKSSYPEYRNGGKALDMSVNNKQGITDGSALNTLDTNTSLSFDIKFNNGQFGIPTSSQGGFDLLDNTPGSAYANGNGSYNSDVINATGGSVGTAKTGTFKFGNENKRNVDGTVGRDSYWSGSLKAGVTTNNASLTYNGDERVGPTGFSFLKGWTGGSFNFKTIKMSTYYLTNGNRNWWEAKYEKGKFYKYGVSYKGTITINGISSAQIYQTDLYTRLASRNLSQPIVRGKFNAKTVGGNIG